MGEQNAREATIQKFLNDFNQKQNKNSEWTWKCGRKGAWIELVRKDYAPPIRNPVSVGQGKPGGNPNAQGGQGQNLNANPQRGVFSQGFSQRLQDGDG